MHSSARWSASAIRRWRVRAPTYFRDVVSITSDGDKRLAIRLASSGGRLSRPPGDAVHVRGAARHTDVGRSSRRFPSAGPYYISGYTPGSRLVLSRNPNYDGRGRPTSTRSSTSSTSTRSSRCSRSRTDGRLRSGRPADRRVRAGRPASSRRSSSSTRSRVCATSRMNTSRPLFATAGGAAGGQPRARPAGPDRHQRRVFGQSHRSVHPADRAGVPRREHLPAQRAEAADLARANALVDQAGIRGQTAVFYTSSSPPALALAQLVKDELARIGHRRRDPRVPARRADRARRNAWRAVRHDAGRLVERLLRPVRHAQHRSSTGRRSARSTTTTSRTSTTRSTNAQLQAAAQLTGTERYTTYGNLDVTLARDQAPLAAIGTFNNRDFFSARMGCQTFVPPYGMDLATLCIKGAHHD